MAGLGTNMIEHASEDCLPFHPLGLFLVKEIVPLIAWTALGFTSASRVAINGRALLYIQNVLHISWTGLKTHFGVSSEKVQKLTVHTDVYLGYQWTGVL